MLVHGSPLAHTHALSFLQSHLCIYFSCTCPEHWLEHCLDPGAKQTGVADKLSCYQGDATRLVMPFLTITQPYVLLEATDAGWNINTTTTTCTGQPTIVHTTQPLQETITQRINQRVQNIGTLQLGQQALGTDAYEPALHLAGLGERQLCRQLP